jgi:hypothetical protein
VSLSPEYAKRLMRNRQPRGECFLMPGLQYLSAIAGTLGLEHVFFAATWFAATWFATTWKTRSLTWFWAVGGGALLWHLLNHAMHPLFDQLRRNNRPDFAWSFITAYARRDQPIESSSRRLKNRRYSEVQLLGRYHGGP